MKNKILILLAIAAFALASCGDDDNDGGVKPHGAPYDHLGIDEPRGADCGDNCTVKSYGVVMGHQIQRLGALDVSKSFTNENIQKAAKDIIDTYGAFNETERGKVGINQIVQILKEGSTEYKDGLLKVLFSDPNITAYLNDKANPACVYGNDGHGIRDGLTNDAGVCGDTGCIGLKDYRTAAAQVKPNPYDSLAIGSPGDYFPWSIYRVGALSNYPGTILDDTVASILAVYKDNTKITPSDKTRLHTSALEQVHVTYSAPWDYYTWDGSNLGLLRGVDPSWIGGLFVDIGNNTLWPEDPIVQQIPTSTGNVRLALNGALRSSVESEQFPAVAARRKWVSVTKLG